MTAQLAPDPDVPAGQEPGRAVAEAHYDRREARWRWSPEMYALLGVADDGGDPEALVFERMHPDDRDRVSGLLVDAVASPGPFAGQYRVRDDAGRERVIAFLGDADRDPSGTPVGLRGLAFDVTDAARAAAAEAVRSATSERAAIEQVKGALMYAHGLDADAAFGVLVRFSQRANVRVVVLAGRAARLLADGGGAAPGASVLAVLEAAVGGRAGPARTSET